MRNRKFWCMTGLVLAGLLLAISTLAVLLKHEPNIYAVMRRPESRERRDEGLQVLAGFEQMNQDRRTKHKDWRCAVTESQLNSFFQEGFQKKGEAERLGHLGISDLVVALDDDRVRVAFRYGSGWFSTVVCYDLQIWLVPKETNTIAIKVLRARAGALPIASRTILQRLAEFAHDLNFDVKFYRHEGMTVATIQLEPSNTYNPYWRLTSVKVRRRSEDGMGVLSVQGKTEDFALPLNLPPAPAAK